MLNPYLEIPPMIAKIIQNRPVPSTNELVSTDYGDITILTDRVSSWDPIINSLPCIYIDVDPSGISYEPYDQGYFRLIPIIILVYIPIRDNSLDDEAAKQAEDLHADREIRSVFSQLEELFNTVIAAGVSGLRELHMWAGGIPTDSYGGSGTLTGYKMRIAILNLLAAQIIP